MAGPIFKNRVIFLEVRGLSVSYLPDIRSKVNYIIPVELVEARCLGRQDGVDAADLVADFPARVYEKVEGFRLIFLMHNKL